MFIAPKIVARNFTEAHKFARETLGLRNGQYRVVTSPASLVGRVGEVYLVPGWDKRPDRWAMKQKLKYTRLTIIDVAEQETPAEVPETSNGENMISEGGPVTIFTEVDDKMTPVLEATEEALDKAYPELSDEEKQDLTEAEADRNAAEARAEQAPADEDNDVTGDDSDNDVEERPLNGRRRRRCKDCGELIHPDDVEDHARDHAADMVSLEQKAQENLR